jgi:putative ubiquitin-RnfH superfamily antitoxin RatB of RatAB toxin-antitoxin module
VEVVRALARQAIVVTIEVPQGATVRDAIEAAGLVHEGEVGIFGERVKPESPLRDGDRIELYRPLAIDPKEARRRRARRSGR